MNPGFQRAMPYAPMMGSVQYGPYTAQLPQPQPQVAPSPPSVNTAWYRVIERLCTQQETLCERQWELYHSRFSILQRLDDERTSASSLDLAQSSSGLVAVSFVMGLLLNILRHPDTNSACGAPPIYLKILDSGLFVNEIVQKLCEIGPDFPVAIRDALQDLRTYCEHAIERHQKTITTAVTQLQDGSKSSEPPPTLTIRNCCGRIDKLREMIKLVNDARYTNDLEKPDATEQDTSQCTVHPSRKRRISQS